MGEPIITNVILSCIQLVIAHKKTANRWRLLYGQVWKLFVHRLDHQRKITFRQSFGTYHGDHQAVRIVDGE